MALTEAAEAWREAGEPYEFRGRRIHVHARPGRGPTVVLLHGFPTSSFDWRPVLGRLGDRAVLAFDFLGFGLSDKPASHVYGLGWQADLTESLIDRHAEGPVLVVAHDMGTSVATELMARDLEGTLGVDVAGALLFNGSIVLARARPTAGQRLLRSPLGPVFSHLLSERVFTHQIGSVFSPRHRLAPAEARDLWTLVRHGGGHRLGHRLVHYMDERETHAQRWHGAIRDWPKPLSLLWGMRDPVAVPAVLDALRELRPQAPVQEIEEIGHYPQLEAPGVVASAIIAAHARGTVDGWG